METAVIDAPVEVVASFGRGGVRPRLFIWERRRYPVTRITAAWVEPEGQFRRHHFAALTDGANLYELCFHTRTLEWRLLRVEHD